MLRQSIGQIRTRGDRTWLAMAGMSRAAKNPTPPWPPPSTVTVAHCGCPRPTTIASHRAVLPRSPPPHCGHHPAAIVPALPWPPLPLSSCHGRPTSRRLRRRWDSDRGRTGGDRGGAGATAAGRDRSRRGQGGARPGSGNADRMASSV